MTTFQNHLVDRLSEIGPFGEWLIMQARQRQSIAIAIRDRQKKIAFATRDESWVVDLKSPAGVIAAGVLRARLVDTNQISLLTRNLSRDLRDLTLFLAQHLEVPISEMYYYLAPACVGDLTTAAKCINQTVTPMGKFKQIEQDAYEIALLEPQYAYGIVPYYEKVGLPLAKVVAEASLFTKADTPLTWWVSYPYLWLRVLTYYCGDPTLSWAFAEHRDPVEAVAKLLKSTEIEAYATLLWQACGRDIPVFTKRFPSLLDQLPDSLEEYGNKLDRTMPAMAMAASQMKNAYMETRNITTLFGRKLRAGAAMGEAVAFRVFGTVEDIVGVAAATFWNNRPTRDILISKFEGGPAAEDIRIGGVGPKTEVEKVSWLTNLKQLAPLGQPLGEMSLSPMIVSP